MRSLPPPHPDLRASVVVPARDEEDLIGSCLQALAAQEGVPHEQYEVLLVLDRCTDSTEARALQVAGAHPSLRLHLLDGPGRGSGQARRVGMDAACSRLLGLGKPRALISSTDADTIVAPDWLAAQLTAADRGARAIGGRIELADDGSLPEGLLDWHAARGDSRRRKLLSDSEQSGEAQHWQFSGASLALTAEVYQQVGGLEPQDTLEDEHLESVLRQSGVPIDRLRSVRVTTSARLVGRAGQGLARDLSAATARLRAALRPGGVENRE